MLDISNINKLSGQITLLWARFYSSDNPLNDLSLQSTPMLRELQCIGSMNGNEWCELQCIGSVNGNTSSQRKVSVVRRDVNVAGCNE